MLMVANRPPHFLLSGTPSAALIGEAIQTIENMLLSSDGMFRPDSCRTCSGDCRYQVQWVQSIEDEWQSGFLEWREISRHLLDAVDEDGNPLAPWLNSLSVDMFVLWLRENFTRGNIERDPEEHFAPMLVEINDAHSSRNWNLFRGGKAFVWYTAGGFRDRVVMVEACLPTKEAAENWRADHLGPKAADEITAERVVKAGLFPVLP